jgi:predicted acetyltransferase
VILVWPSLDRLPSYVEALKRGFSPDNVRGEAASIEQLAKIEADASGFVASLVDREAKGEPIALADGTLVPRLPGYVRWMWDGEFCGSIGFRWRPGTETLPPTCLGHIGYSVVEWKRRRGFATEALRQVLPDAKSEGLRYVEITTDVDNVPSQRVVVANGGVLVEEFTKPKELGGTQGLRYRIHLD